MVFIDHVNSNVFILVCSIKLKKRQNNAEADKPQYLYQKRPRESRS